jgi:hypothetical protein
LGAKRTCLIAAQMSVSDPKRTFAPSNPIAVIVMAIWQRGRA